MSTVPWPVLVPFALLGLAVGSFLNVVVYRVPRGESIAFPASHCPQCRTVIKSRHNVPVLGWLMLRGKCATCRLPISARYPLVEAGTAVLMIALTARFGLTAVLPAYLFFAAVAVTLALIAADRRELPDTIVLPAYIGAALLLMPAGAEHGTWGVALRAVVGMAAMTVLYLALRIGQVGGICGGDVQLAGFVGMFLGWLSWDALLVGILLGLAVGAITAGTASVVTRRGGTLTVAYGPCMVAGAATALFVAVPVTHWYAALVSAA